MSTQLRNVVIGLVAVLALSGVLAGSAGAATAAAPAGSTTAPAAAGEGVGCSSTRACTVSNGGAYIVTSKESCTAGLPVRSRTGQWYVVTAGHCVGNNIGATWRQSGIVLGRGTRWEYGGRGTEGAAGTSDIGLIKVASSPARTARSRVLVLASKARTQRITGAKDAKAGERVCVTAGRTGTTRCGTVVSADTSLTYASPGLRARTIRNLALVRGVCVNPGDSGSPVFAGHSAVGVTVAKSASGCYFWYAKLPAQLRHFGLRVVG